MMLPIPLRHPDSTHRCAKCGGEQAIAGDLHRSDRFETITVCSKGGTCVYARKSP